ncbi:MAG: DUF1642 domain-containing protein [Enterococcus hirae]|uniref:DUF1642 domain-containing protein n=1 Tax=Enterococcus hirae TaxID=1354 RepID=UPI00054D5941|nr:DUF1642 domain-containing protein [Enterococcus hirae]OWW67341.1 hypothetical protein C655_08900 [Enterococcus hirae 57-09-G6]EMF0043866.1 DUF1642 domain-containing protein [Enterococcus hirae]EMF0058184.1 DUF1642 domain-containing protein [Enterococcus hirae]EMF0120983.1 DUF1642 domain-containing protein [Enterococcus hirae]EMF0442501.1 DUF1642 domain-containing protein [Enterococcus hirae]
MNKQELIEELARHASCLEDFRGITGHCDGKYEAYEIAIELAKKLDEPQKPVVPQFVGDWIELCKEKADLISCLSGSYEYGVDQYKRITEDEDWLFEADHQELVARAWLYGYEVEKEPLYEVIVGNLFLVKKFTDRNDISFVNKFELRWWEKSAYQLTEPEIKAIDERYWAFAVPVEEVAEG